MITLKQIEAFYTIAKVGSFVAAADSLRTTQPALSKRIAEMEMSIGTSLFDRSLRTVQLTAKSLFGNVGQVGPAGLFPPRCVAVLADMTSYRRRTAPAGSKKSLRRTSAAKFQTGSKGHAILKLCEEMLTARSEILAIAGERLRYSGVFRMGITELAALTILPELVGAITSEFPEIDLHPEVNLSLNLYEKLEHGKLDLAIVPGTYRGELVSEFLGDVRLKCMCHPIRFACPDRVEIKELARFH